MNILSIIEGWKAPNEGVSNSGQWINTTGLQYHRQIAPLNHLGKNYDVTIHKIDNIKKLFIGDEENGYSIGSDVRNYDIVSFLRNVSTNGNGVEIIKAIQQQGVKVVIDIDDYWNLPSYHPMKEGNDKARIAEQQKNELRQADYVTTTTSHFAYNYIRPINKNVEVLANALDSENDTQWVADRTESSKTRFGWVGGIFHAKDLEQMFSSFNQAYTNSATKDLNFQFCLGGYNKNPEYDYIERLMTGNYSHLDKWYVELLKSDVNVGDHYSLTQKYRRLKARMVNEYGFLYDEIDVAFAPLLKNDFTSCKSPLKIIEAGFKGCAVIAQNVQPFTPIINKNNSFIVDKKEDWFKWIKYCLLNKEVVKDKASQLHEDMLRDFNMNVWGKKRYDLYKRIIE